MSPSALTSSSNGLINFRLLALRGEHHLLPLLLFTQHRFDIRRHLHIINQPLRQQIRLRAELQASHQLVDVVDVALKNQRQFITATLAGRSCQLFSKNRAITMKTMALIQGARCLQVGRLDGPGTFVNLLQFIALVVHIVCK